MIFVYSRVSYMTYVCSTSNLVQGPFKSIYFLEEKLSFFMVFIEVYGREIKVNAYLQTTVSFFYLQNFDNTTVQTSLIYHKLMKIYRL